MIEGVLRHCTDMSIEKNFTDSHGQSEVAFCFARLLGFDLMPRLKAIDRQKLYLPGRGTAGRYPNLGPVLTRAIGWSLGADRPGPSHYMASKMGVIGFARGLANDIAEDGITVNAILPAVTNTPDPRDLPGEDQRRSRQQQAIKRLAGPGRLPRQRRRLRHQRGARRRRRPLQDLMSCAPNPRDLALILTGRGSIVRT